MTHPPDSTRIIEMASAFFDSCVLFAASDLNVFSTLSEAGPSSSEAVAGTLGLDSRAARLLMDGCVAAGLLHKEGNLFRNTAESDAFLVRGRPGDLSRALWYNRDVYPAWSKLAAFVRDGAPVESPQEHLGDDEERTRAFVLSMHYRALGMGRAVVPLLELGSVRQLLDVGGGPGTFSALIAQAYPHLHSTVLDLPPVVRIASDLLRQQGVSDRVSVLAGDYHTTPFPGGNDAVHFFGMLHQESPETILSLLERGFEALRPGGIVNVMDMMTDATHTSPKFSALFAVNMALTTLDGWVFSDAELAGWMKRAGFVDFAVKALPTPLPHWLATARRPPL